MDTEEYDIASVLFITAHPLDHTKSMSMAAGREFLVAYQERNTADTIAHVDLYKEYVPQIDADVLQAWGSLATGASFESLTPEQQQKAGRLAELLDQFLAAEKYVFVSPMWNFAFPPVLKAYVDAVCVAGKTFRYADDGQVIGMLSDKRAVHIQARGGLYAEGEHVLWEMGHRYLSTILTFLGVPKVEHVFMEGHAIFPAQAEEIRNRGIQHARELAATF